MIKMTFIMLNVDIPPKL